MESTPRAEDRRRRRTRAALIAAAQQIIVMDGDTNASVQSITDLADVGLGSFYNHFESKSELFDAALAETLEQHSVWLEHLLADEPDPAAALATSVRLTGRLSATNPRLGTILLRNLEALLTSDSGPVPRARRDLAAAIEAGRLPSVTDADVAVSILAGGLAALMRLGSTLEPNDLGRLVDTFVADILRLYGMETEEARELSSRALAQPAV